MSCPVVAEPLISRDRPCVSLRPSYIEMTLRRVILKGNVQLAFEWEVPHTRADLLFIHDLLKQNSAAHTLNVPSFNYLQGLLSAQFRF